MLYREFLGSLSDEDLAQLVVDDTVLRMACVENLVGSENLCKFDYKDCHKCVLALLVSDSDAIIKRDNIQD